MRIAAFLVAIILAPQALAQQCSSRTEAQCKPPSCQWDALGNKCVPNFYRFDILRTAKGDLPRISTADPAKLDEIFKQLYDVKALPQPQPGVPSQVQVDILSKGDMKALQDQSESITAPKDVSPQ